MLQGGRQMVIPKAKLLPSGNWNIVLRLNKQCISKTFKSESEAIEWARAYKETYKKAQNKQDQYEALLRGISQEQNITPDVEQKHLPTIAEELDLIDKMDGITFEKYCMNLIMITGCFKGGSIHLTKKAQDYGADIIIECIDKTKISIQCKRVAEGVRIGAVQEVISSKQHYGTNVAAVITNSHFTKQATILAQESGVALIDRKKLIKLIQMKIDALDELYNTNQWDQFLSKMDLIKIKKEKA